MDEPSKKVRVQVGVRFEPTPSEVIPSIIETAANANLARSSLKTLAELCDSTSSYKKRRRKGDEAGQADEEEEEEEQATCLSLPKRGKKAAPRPPPISFTAPSSSMGSSKKDLGPQVEVVDGKIVLKESSLTVESLEAGTQEEYEEVEEGAAGGSSRYSSYSNRRPAKVWGLEETRLFYSAVRQCGTDFSMMQAFFPHRTRREVKHKFRREEQAHPELVKLALQTVLPLEMVPFEVSLGVELVVPNAVAEAMEAVQEVAFV